MALSIAIYLNQQPLLAYWASVIAQVSFLAASTLCARRFRLKLQLGVMVTALGILLMLSAVEVVSLLSNLQRIWNPSLPLVDLQAQLSGLAFNIAAPLMLVALFTWAAVLPLAVRNIRRGSMVKTGNEPRQTVGSVWAILLFVGVLISVVVAISPYASGGGLRGVDTRTYYDLLSSMGSLTDALKLFSVDYKALVLFLFYAMEAATGWGPYRVIIVGPAALAALFVVVSYLFVLGLTRDRLTAGFSAILAATSFQVSVGIYAGIFANLFAISFVVLVLYFLTSPLSGVRALLLLLASYMALLAHVYAWGILMLAVGVSAILTAVLWLMDRSRSALRDSVRMHLLLLFGGCLPVIVAYLGGYLGLLSPAMLSPVTGSVSISHIGGVMFILSVTLTRYVGAIFAYPLPLTLAILGFIILARTNVRAIGPLVGLYAATSLATLLLDSQYQWRLLYLIPFQALAAVGLAALLRGLEWGAARVGIEPSSRLLRFSEVLLIGVILIDSVNYALIEMPYLPVS